MKWKTGVKWVSNFLSRRKKSADEVFSGPYFSVFSPNTGKYRPEKTEHWKIRTRKNSVFGHFSHSDLFCLQRNTGTFFQYFQFS